MRDRTLTSVEVSASNRYVPSVCWFLHKTRQIHSCWDTRKSPNADAIIPLFHIYQEKTGCGSFHHPTAPTTGCWGRSLGTTLGNSVGTAAPCKEEDEFWKNSTHSRHNATCQPLNTAQINRPDSWSSARWNCLSKPWALGTGGEPGDKAGPFRTRVCRVAPWVSAQGELRVGNGVRRGGGTSLCSVVS